MKPENAPFPTEDWYEEKELDETIHVFSYEINGNKKEIAFWIRSISSLEARTISGRHEQKDGTIDDAAHSDDLILECVSSGIDKKGLSRKQLDSMKLKKKGGLVGQILAAVLLQSGADQETIDAEKNSESPIASSQSS